MLKTFPPVLRYATYGFLLGVLGFFGVLVVSKPLSYIATMGLGCLGTGIGVVCFLLYFVRELKAEE